MTNRRSGNCEGCGYYRRDIVDGECFDCRFDRVMVAEAP